MVDEVEHGPECGALYGFAGGDEFAGVDDAGGFVAIAFLGVAASDVVFLVGVVGVGDVAAFEVSLGLCFVLFAYGGYLEHSGGYGCCCCDGCEDGAYDGYFDG